MHHLSDVVFLSTLEKKTVHFPPRVRQETRSPKPHEAQEPQAAGKRKAKQHTQLTTRSNHSTSGTEIRVSIPL
jgi:hypothetical protein